MDKERIQYEKFVFYGSFRDTIEALPEEMGNKILRAIMNYGTAYELPEIKPDDSDSAIIYSIMQLIIPNIEAQKAKYESKSNGGRPVNYTQKDFDDLFDCGFTNERVKEQIGCSMSTVERRKRIWNNKIPDISNKQSDISHEKSETGNETSDTRHQILDSEGYEGYDGKDNFPSTDSSNQEEGSPEIDNRDNSLEEMLLADQIKELEDGVPRYEYNLELIKQHITEDFGDIWGCDDGLYYNKETGEAYPVPY